MFAIETLEKERNWAWMLMTGKVTLGMSLWPVSSNPIFMSQEIRS